MRSRIYAARCGAMARGAVSRIAGCGRVDRTSTGRVRRNVAAAPLLVGSLLFAAACGSQDASGNLPGSSGSSGGGTSDDGGAGPGTGGSMDGGAGTDTSGTSAPDSSVAGDSQVSPGGNDATVPVGSPTCSPGFTGSIAGAIGGANACWGPGDVIVTGEVDIPPGVTLTI